MALCTFQSVAIFLKMFVLPTSYLYQNQKEIFPWYPKGLKINSINASKCGMKICVKILERQTTGSNPQLPVLMFSHFYHLSNVVTDIYNIIETHNHRKLEHFV